MKGPADGVRDSELAALPPALPCSRTLELISQRARPSPRAACTATTAWLCAQTDRQTEELLGANSRLKDRSLEDRVRVRHRPREQLW